MTDDKTQLPYHQLLLRAPAAWALLQDATVALLLVGSARSPSLSSVSLLQNGFYCINDT